MSSSHKLDSVSILVHPNDLRGANHNGVRKENRFARRKCLRMWRRVSVEAAPALVRDRVFYAPDIMHGAQHTSRTPTEFIKATPESPNVVRKGDEFEISFVGMNVTPQDTLACNENELFLYSLYDGEDSSAATQAQEIQHGKGVAMENGFLVSTEFTNSPSSPRLQRIGSLNSVIAPTSALGGKDLPFIHYDPLRDGRKKGTEPNSYVTIPASMSLYKQFKTGNKESTSGVHKHTSVRFTVLDIDNLTDEQLQILGGVTQLGELVELGAVAVPYVDFISHAFQAVATIGRRSLKKYSQPDHVFSVDIQFLLADAAEPACQVDSETYTNASETPKAEIGNYLRYGYYFFLEKSIDARVYSQTRSSSQYVPLLLRRTDLQSKKRKRNELEYFPLTNVSYVVMKVSRGCTQNVERRNKGLCGEHKKRLDTVLQARNISGIFTRENNRNRRSSAMRPSRPF